jgi:hypothetical protein
MKILYLIGLLLSAGIGIWHFTAPYLYKWYSYIPDAPPEIIMSINYVNYFFSLLLTGVSIILIVLQKDVFAKNIVALIFYGFLVFVWLNRIVITILMPWPNNIPFTVGLICIFTIIFAIQLVPLVYLCKNKRKS